MKVGSTKRWIIGFVSLLIGCFVFLSMQRYLAFKKLVNAGAELSDWTGSVATAENRIREKISGYRQNGIPFSSIIFLSRPLSISIDTETLKQFNGYREMGRAYGKIGKFQSFFVFLDEVHPDFLEGLGDQPEMTFFYCGHCKVFNDEALSMFTQFPKLKEIDLFAPTFTGSGLPPLENLESIVIADATNLSDAFFEKLKGCPNLKEVDIQTISRSFDFEKAKIILSTHPTIQKANLDCWDGSFTWEKSAAP